MRMRAEERAREQQLRQAGGTRPAWRTALPFLGPAPPPPAPPLLRRRFPPPPAAASSCRRGMKYLSTAMDRSRLITCVWGGGAGSRATAAALSQALRGVLYVHPCSLHGSLWYSNCCFGGAPWALPHSQPCLGGVVEDLIALLQDGGLALALRAEALRHGRPAQAGAGERSVGGRAGAAGGLRRSYTFARFWRWTSSGGPTWLPARPSCPPRQQQQRVPSCGRSCRAQTRASPQQA